MKNDIHTRTKQLIFEHLKLNPNKFATLCKHDRPAVYYAIGTKTRKSVPSYEFIVKTVRTFPQINLVWWILGEGKWDEQSNKIEKLKAEIEYWKDQYANERLKKR